MIHSLIIRGKNTLKKSKEHSRQFGEEVLEKFEARSSQAANKTQEELHRSTAQVEETLCPKIKHIIECGVIIH